MPAAIEAKTVLTPTGKFFVDSISFNKCKVPWLAAVSPNLLNGPFYNIIITYNKAGATPE